MNKLMKTSFCKYVVGLTLICSMFLLNTSCGGGGSSKNTSSDCSGCYFEPSLVNVGWTWLNPAPQGDSLYDNIWTNTQLIAVGANGRIMTSSNGVSWTIRNSGTTNALQSIAWSGTRLVVGGNSGTILTSDDDGVTWVKRSYPTGNLPAGLGTILSVIWDGTQFVAVGKNKLIIKSTDGVNWTLISLVGDGSSYNDLVDVAYSGSLYVAVGFTGKVLTSSDGENWSEVGAGIADILHSLAWTGSAFVAGGSSNAVYTSSDGINWTTHSVDAVSSTTSIPDLEVLGGVLYAVARGALDNDLFVSGDDGASWTAYQTGAASSLYSITKKASSWNVVGRAGVILNSSAISTWTSASSGIPSGLGAIAKKDDSSIIVAAGGGVTLTSTDGSTWTDVQHLNKNFQDITYGNGVFVAVGSSGVIKTSPDGINWSSMNSGIASRLNSVIWDGARFVVVGDSGKILTSTDGTVWAEQSSGVTQELNRIAWSGSEYIAVGSNGTILRSTDSVSWSSLASNTSQALTGIVWTGSTYVVVGYGYLETTKDFVTWQAPLGDGGELFTDVTMIGSRIIALGIFGTIFGSDDAVNWYRWGTPTENELSGAIEYNSTIMVVGSRGTILQSENMSGF